MADDAGVAAVAALVVDVLELLEDEGLQAALAERPGGGGPHRAAAEHDDVEGGVVAAQFWKSSAE